MSQPNEQVTAAPLRIDGVSDLDPEGHIPLEQLTNGTTIRIPRWPRFPGPPDPGEAPHFSILYIYWNQNSVETLLYERTYTYVDDRPEFTFPLTAQQMSAEGTALIYYVLEGYDGNYDRSDRRQLTIRHARLNPPEFPSATLNGYLNCDTLPPIWEKILIGILPETVFRERDELILEWQGFATLNGEPPELTPKYEIPKTLSVNDASKGFIMEIPFVPYVKPMVDEDSAVAQYRLVRNGIVVARSEKGYVKIDRKLSGSPPCGGWP